MTEEEVRLLAADIIGDLLNMRVILDTCSERKLSAAETYITRRITDALELSRRQKNEPLPSRDAPHTLPPHPV